MKENWRMSTCNWLDLQTLGSQAVILKNLPDHWCRLLPFLTFSLCKFQNALQGSCLCCCLHLCLGCALFVKIRLVVWSWDQLCASSSRHLLTFIGHKSNHILLMLVHMSFFFLHKEIKEGWAMIVC